MSAVVAWTTWACWRAIRAVACAAAAMGRAEVGYWLRCDAEASGRRAGEGARPSRAA